MRTLMIGLASLLLASPAMASSYYYHSGYNYTIIGYYISAYTYTYSPSDTDTDTDTDSDTDADTDTDTTGTGDTGGGKDGCNCDSTGPAGSALGLVAAAAMFARRRR